MYGLEWRTVCTSTSVIFSVYIGSKVTCIFVFIIRHIGSVNGDQEMTYRLRVSLVLFTFWWWRHNGLCNASWDCVFIRILTNWIKIPLLRKCVWNVDQCIIHFGASSLWHTHLTTHFSFNSHAGIDYSYTLSSNRWNYWFHWRFRSGCDCVTKTINSKMLNLDCIFWDNFRKFFNIQ